MKTFTSIVLLLCAAAAALAARGPKPKPRLNPEAEALRVELARFPSARVCENWLAFADHHLDWIDWQLALFPYERDEWGEYRMQVCAAREMWRSLLAAHNSYYDPAYRREALKCVREGIGEWNWLLGHVPPPVAVHMLRQCD